LDELFELELDELFELELDELLEFEFEELLEFEFEELFEFEFEELFELELDELFELEFDELLAANCRSFSSCDEAAGARATGRMLLMPPVSVARGATVACETPAVPVIASAKASRELSFIALFMTVSIPFIAATDAA
jgi:hypothetical protein